MKPPCGPAIRAARRSRTGWEAAEAEREEVRTAIRHAGADHLVLSTAGDWLQVLAGHLRRNEAALRAGNPGRTAVANRMGARK